MVTGHAGLDLLLRVGVIDRGLAIQALELARATDGHVIECLVAAGADERRIADCYAQRLHVATVESDRLLRAEHLSLVPFDMALEFFAVPVGRGADGDLLVALADPTDVHARDEIAFFAGVDVSRAVARVSAIRDAIAAGYGIELTAMLVPIARRR